MNDFTKEELCLIEKYIGSYECDLHTFDTEVKPVLNKIALLIENYRKHDCPIQGCNGKLFPVCCVTGHISE